MGNLVIGRYNFAKNVLNNRTANISVTLKERQNVSHPTEIFLVVSSVNLLKLSKFGATQGGVYLSRFILLKISHLISEYPHLNF